MKDTRRRRDTRGKGHTLGKRMQWVEGYNGYKGGKDTRWR